jgi:flagella basal body P-ring formation protein FlgA
MILAAAAFALAIPGLSCTSIEHDQITGADLANADSVFSSLPAEQVFGPAPAPGNRRVLLLSEVQRIAEKQGISAKPERDLCFEWTLQQLEPASVLAAMQESLSEARIEIVELSKYPVPNGRLIFPVSGLQRIESSPLLWRGHIEYGGQRKFSVWARVKVLVSARVVQAAENLRAGQPIRSDQLQTVQYEGPPLVGTFAGDVSDVLGRIPRGFVRSGTRINVSLLELPKDVSRGDLVTVEARIGAARVSVQARATSSGRRGELVQLQNESSGKMFRATIDSPGRAVIEMGAR